MGRVIEIEPVLTRWIKANNAISTIIGSRIYPDNAPKKPANSVTEPYIVYHLISGSPFFTLDGADNVQMVRIQYDCMAFTQEQCKRLAAVLRDEFHQFNHGTMEEVLIQSIRADDIRDNPERPITATEVMDYKRTVDIVVHYREDT